MDWLLDGQEQGEAQREAWWGEGRSLGTWVGGRERGGTETSEAGTPGPQPWSSATSSALRTCWQALPAPGNVSFDPSSTPHWNGSCYSHTPFCAAAARAPHTSAALHLMPTTTPASAGSTSPRPRVPCTPRACALLSGLELCVFSGQGKAPLASQPPAPWLRLGHKDSSPLRYCPPMRSPSPSSHRPTRW